MGLVIQTPDRTHAEVDVTGLTIDADGNVTLNYQKVLVDDTDGTRQPDGQAATLTLQTTDALELVAAIEPVLTPIVTGMSGASAEGGAESGS